MIEGRIPTRIVLDRIQTGLGINPREHPIALSLVFKHLRSDEFRHPQTGLIRHDKIHSFAEALVKTGELSAFIKGRSPEALRDEIVKWQIVSSPEKEQQMIEQNDVELLEALSKSEDAEAGSLINSAIILVASKKFGEVKTPEEVINILNLFQQHLPQVYDEMGVNCGLFFEILIGMAEVAKEKLEAQFEAAVKEQLGVMMEEKDLVHHLLHIITWEGINRVAYFREMADGYMAIGPVSSEEHLRNMAKIAGITDRTKLIEPPGVVNPDEDAALNHMVTSLRLPRFLPSTPILVEKGRIYKLNENGEKAEVVFDLLENYQNLEIDRMVRELQGGLKFNNAPVEDFVLIPVRNGKQLGFVYIDNAYDKTPIDVGKLTRRIGYAGSIIDAALKRGKAKNDKMIGQLLQDWLKGYRTRSKPSDVMSGYLNTYIANILRKEKAGHIRIVDVKQLVSESLNRLLPSGVNATINVEVSADASHIYYQPYHLQGVVDGLVMNAIWSHVAAGDKDYKINIKVERQGDKLILTQTNGGQGSSAIGFSDYGNMDLGAAIITDSLDVRICDISLGPDYQGPIYHGTPRLLGASENEGPGLAVTLTDAEFVSRV